MVRFQTSQSSLRPGSYVNYFSEIHLHYPENSKYDNCSSLSCADDKTGCKEPERDSMDKKVLPGW